MSRSGRRAMKLTRISSGKYTAGDLTFERTRKNLFGCPKIVQWRVTRGEKLIGHFTSLAGATMAIKDHTT